MFTKLVSNYLGDDEYAALQWHLVEHPGAGPVIKNSGGVRKLRWAARGKGKSGGVRVIYYVQEEEVFWMLTIYRKGDMDSIRGPLLRKIKEAMDNG